MKLKVFLILVSDVRLLEYSYYITNSCSTKLSAVYTVQTLYCYCGTACSRKNLRGNEASKVFAVDRDKY